MDEVGGKGILLLHSVRFPAGQSRAQRSWGISGPKMTDSTGTETVPPQPGGEGAALKGPKALLLCSAFCSSAAITGALALLDSFPDRKALFPEHRLGSARVQYRPWFCTYWLLLAFFTLKRCMPQSSCGEREDQLSLCTPWQHRGLGTAPLFWRGDCAFQAVLAPQQLPLPSDTLPSSPPEGAGRHLNPFTLAG